MDFKKYINLKKCLEDNNIESVSSKEKKCFQCKKKKKFPILEECECGIIYCIKHRFHDCQEKKKKIKLPEPASFKKIDKI